MYFLGYKIRRSSVPKCASVYVRVQVMFVFMYNAHCTCVYMCVHVSYCVSVQALVSRFVMFNYTCFCSCLAEKRRGQRAGPPSITSVPRRWTSALVKQPHCQPQVRCVLTSRAFNIPDVFTYIIKFSSTATHAVQHVECRKSKIV